MPYGWFSRARVYHGGSGTDAGANPFQSSSWTVWSLVVPQIPPPLAAKLYYFSDADTSIGAIQFISGNAAGTSSVAIPTPRAGDLIIVFTRGDIAIPSLAAGYTAIGTRTNGALSTRVACKVSDGTETTSGTWGLAVQIVALVYRGPVGVVNNTSAIGNSAVLTYGALTLAVTNGTSWVVGVGAASAATAGMNGVMPVLRLNRASLGQINGLDTGNGVQSYAGETLAVTGSGIWITWTLELAASYMSPLSWKPAPLRQYPLPKSVRYLYWNTAHDTRFSNPSTPLSWRNNRLQQTPVPRALFNLLYRYDPDTRFSNPSTPLSWVGTRMQTTPPPRSLFNLLYRYGWDTSRSNDEQIQPWTPTPLRQRYAGRPSFYFSADLSSTVTPDTPLSWIARPVRSAFGPRPIFYFSADLATSNDEAPLSWTVSPLQPPSLRLHRALYWSLDTGQDTGEENDEQPLSWTPPQVRVPWSAQRAASFLYSNQSDTASSQVEQPLPWHPQRVAQPPSAPWWLYLHQPATDTEVTGEGPVWHAQTVRSFIFPDFARLAYTMAGGGGAVGHFTITRHRRQRRG